MRLSLRECSKMVGQTLIAFQLCVVPGIVSGQVKKDQSAVSARRPITVRADGASDPSFAEFRKELLAAAQAGNRQALMKMMSPSVSVSFESAKPESALDDFGFVNGQPWRALVNALALGSARVDETFFACRLSRSACSTCNSCRHCRDRRPCMWLSRRPATSRRAEGSKARRFVVGSSSRLLRYR